MKKIYFLFIAVAFSSIMLSQTLNLEDIIGNKYRSKTIESIVSSIDGESYFQANPEHTKITRYSYNTGQPIETILDINTARDNTISSFDGFLISPDENRILVYTNAEPIYRHSFSADYYYFDIRRNLIRKLTDNKGKQKNPVFSRDGRMLAYIINNNIWLSKFDYGTESQVTTDGKSGEIINGATDWVYEEEFGITTLMDFSPDNKLLAFVRFDEKNVPEFSFQKFGGQLYPSSVSFKYPKAGESNAKVSSNVFDIESKTLRKITFPEGSDIEYIAKIEFTPTSQLALATLNRNQNDFKLFLADPRSTISKLVLRDQNERYINPEFLNSIHFLGDQFTYISEKDGYSHIYLYSSTGVLLKQVTAGNYDVTEILACDPVSKVIYFQSAQDSPLSRSIHKIDIVKNTDTRLSSKTGYNTASFSNNGKYYINYWSDSSTPTVISLHDAYGKQLRILEDNKLLKHKLSLLSIPEKEYITIKLADETDLNAWVLKPTDFNSNNRYPLLMVQYSGPDSQQVLDRYGIDWYYYLVSQGYIVVCVDGRGTGARGEDFRKSTYMNLGIKESDDQIAAARYFATLPYIDASDISIWGWSYGGYNVLMSMSRGDGIFKSGIAIAPVTDWRFYDSIYTERFMRTPQQNTLGYDAGSPIKLANNLEGRLLLIHGSADDNVHYQNTMEYVKKLINANKDFEMFTFPDLNHSIPGDVNRLFLYKKVIQFLKKN